MGNALEIVGADLLNKTTARVIGELAQYDDIVAHLADVGIEVTRKRLQIWYHRNNYGLRDLACRDGSDPWFHWPTMGEILIGRIGT